MAKFLPPRTTTNIRIANTPAQGELLFDTDTNKLYIGDGITIGGIEVGTGASTGGSGTGLTYEYKISNFTANPNTINGVSTESGSIVATLPQNPPAGTIIAFNDYSSNFSINNLTIEATGTNTIAGYSSLILDNNNATVQLVFFSNKWTVYGTESFVDNTTNQTDSISTIISYIIAGAVG